MIVAAKVEEGVAAGPKGQRSVEPTGKKGRRMKL